MRTTPVVVLALIVGTFFTAQEVFMDLARRHPEFVRQDIANGLEFWVLWALLTPVALVALRRWPLDAKPIYRSVLAHTFVALVLAVVHNGIAVAIHRSLSPVAFVWGMFTGLVFYCMLALVWTAFQLHESAAALEAELTRSKLEALRSQLRPHFLFNTLNAISVFVVEDSEKAQRLLLRLASLLRRSLDAEVNEVPLQQELAFVNDYLDIQRGRFGDQLSVQLSVDPEVLHAHVPVFLLQPLLENAIEHGKSSDACTTIALHADRDRDMLHISLADEGPGVALHPPMREGIGLSNTRARLHHLYGPRATVELNPARVETPFSGTCVEIRIPLRNGSV